MTQRSIHFTAQPDQTPEYASLRRWGLFDGMIFGPVQSRRFGRSLGINTLPSDRKICSFDCIYCELGRTTLTMTEMVRGNYPAAGAIIAELDSVLDELSSDPPDALTLTGNGEPTMHPQFASIVDGVLDLRARKAPGAIVGVLTNGTYIDKAPVAHALDEVDVVMLKLDSGTAATMDAVDIPLVAWNPDRVVRAAAKLRRVVIQSLFLEGKVVNTSESEITAWLELLKIILPESVVIYSLDRVPPEPGLRTVPRETLDAIRNRVADLGIDCELL